MARAEGDAIKAEQLMDCSFFTYYYRVYQSNIYIKQKEKEK